MQYPLNIPEEIVLLSINENSGEIEQGKLFQAVLASAFLANLAVHQRIDTDDKTLIKVSNQPTGDILLDEVLHQVFSINENRDPAYWVSQVALRADELLESIIAGLITKQFIRVENQKVLWMFSSRKYPVIGDQQVEEVKSRIRTLIMSKDIPDVKDLVIVSLCYYGNMLELLFSADEIKRYQVRLEQVAKMDLIGQSLAIVIKDLSLASKLSNIARETMGTKSPEKMLEEEVERLKSKYKIKTDKDLPDWLRKGSPQYLETLKFVKEKNTADIFYSVREKKYHLKQFHAQGHLFGSGEK